MTVAPTPAEPPLSAVTEDLEATPEVPAAPEAPVTPGPAPCMSRCGHCGNLAYPPRELCHRCGQPGGTPEPLTPSGRLYTWSTVHASASRPVSYTIGYVDLDSGLRVLARLAGDAGALGMGTAVRLVPESGELTFRAVAGGAAGVGGTG